MADDEDNFLELTVTTATGNDLVDYFHLDSHRTLDGRICHKIGRESESWRRARRPIGTGGFGTAWLEKEQNGGTRVVKEVKKVISGAGANYWFRELQALALLSKNREHFPLFYGWFQDLEYVSIAMEHLGHGDLAQCMHQAVSEDQAQIIVRQVSHALRYMHARHIAHRDLKPTNILVRHPGPSWRVVVSDFGVSKRVRGPTTAFRTSSEGDFMAPEILGFIDDDTRGEYTNAVDAWSLGCLAYWLLHCMMPVPRSNLRKYCTLPWSQAAASVDMGKASASAKDFILNLLTPKPDDRVNTAQACNHAWLSTDAGNTTVNAPIPANTQLELKSDTASEETEITRTPSQAQSSTAIKSSRFKVNDVPVSADTTQSTTTQQRTLAHEVQSADAHVQEQRREEVIEKMADSPDDLVDHGTNKVVSRDFGTSIRPDDSDIATRESAVNEFAVEEHNNASATRQRSAPKTKRRRRKRGPTSSYQVQETMEKMQISQASV